MRDIILWHVGKFTVHGETLIMTGLVFLLIFLFVFLCMRKLTSDTPGKLQNVLEWILDFVHNIISDNMDYKIGGQLFFYLTSLVVFIFFSNMIGIVPNFLAPIWRHVQFAGINEMFGSATLSSPTSDLNTTLALATLSFILFLSFGIRYKRAKYFKHFVEPYPFFAPIQLIDLIAKPLTLSIRLFGNMYADEVLVSVILMLPGAAVFGGLLPLPIWLGFSVFVAVIQAYVFTVLTTAYVAQAVEE